MKQKITGIILVLVSVVLIILGIVVPNKIEQNAISYNYKSHVVNFSEKNFVITITAGKQYQIYEANIELEKVSGETLLISVTSSAITETKEDKNYIYAISVTVNNNVNSGIISKVSKLTIQSNNGNVEVSYDAFPSTNSAVFIRIVLFTLAILFAVSSLFFAIAKRKQTKLESYEQSLAELRIQEEENQKAELENFIDNIKKASAPKAKICEYCSSENENDAKRCTSCGAKLKSR